MTSNSYKPFKIKKRNFSQKNSKKKYKAVVLAANIIKRQQ